MYVDENSIEKPGVYLISFAADANQAQKDRMRYGDRVRIYFQGVEQDAILKRGAFCEWVAEAIPGTDRLYEWDPERDPYDA